MRQRVAMADGFTNHVVIKVFKALVIKLTQLFSLRETMSQNFSRRVQDFQDAEFKVVGIIPVD